MAGTIAVVDATGAVARETAKAPAERTFRGSGMAAVRSGRSAGSDSVA
jgi:hypothetical protein